MRSKECKEMHIQHYSFESFNVSTFTLGDVFFCNLTCSPLRHAWTLESHLLVLYPYSNFDQGDGLVNNGWNPISSVISNEKGCQN
jgi:hypothetical protein